MTRQLQALFFLRSYSVCHVCVVPFGSPYCKELQREIPQLGNVIMAEAGTLTCPEEYIS